jgi:hypothetical protein
MKKALLLIGCPEAPAQTPIAIYTTYKLRNLGYDVTISSNPAASKLIKVSDPEKNYIQNMVNIDSCIDNLEEKEYDLLIGIIHKDAAVSYFVTYYHLLNTKSMAIIFQRNQDEVDDFVEQVKENTDAETISAKAYHNPTPIKVRIDKALKQLEGE